MEKLDLIIQKSTQDKLNQLAYQAKNDTRGFKNIILLAILDDLIQWTEDFDDFDSVRYLKSKADQLLSEDPKCFVIPDVVRFNDGIYTNVNLPQNTYTWNQLANRPFDPVSPMMEINNLVITE